MDYGTPARALAYSPPRVTRWGRLTPVVEWLARRTQPVLIWAQGAERHARLCQRLERLYGALELARLLGHVALSRCPQMCLIHLVATSLNDRRLAIVAEISHGPIGWRAAGPGTPGCGCVYTALDVRREII